MFKLEELPYNQFERLGMSKKDVTQLPTRTLNALLSGQRTDLMIFNALPNFEGGLEGKLSLRRGNEGKPELQITPVKKYPETKYNVTEKEMKEIEDSDKIKFVQKEFTNKQTKQPYKVLVTLDKDTNNLVAIRQDTIKPPLEINNIPLTEQQKLDFKKGKEITVNGDKYIVNPTSELGITNQFGDTRKINQLKTDKYQYDSKQLLMDVALATSAIGSIVLVGHLIRISNTTMTAHRENLNNPDYRKAINNIDTQIKDYTKENNKPPTQQITSEIINSNLQKYNLGVYEGKLIDYGAAPYQYKQDASSSFFIKIEKDGKERELWGSDLKNVIDNSKVQKGEEIKIEYQGKEDIRIPIKESQQDGSIQTTWKVAQKNIWDIYKAPPLEQNKKQSASTKIASTDNVKSVQKGDLTEKKTSKTETIKDSNPEIKKAVDTKVKKVKLEKKESAISIDQKPKSQEKKSRGKAIKH